RSTGPPPSNLPLSRVGAEPPLRGPPVTMSFPFMNQLNELSIHEPTQHFGQNGVHQSSIEIAVDQRQHIGKARQFGAEFFPFSSEWYYLSKHTSSDLFGRLILRPRLTIGNGIAHTCALSPGAKNPNASYRLNWQVARDLRSDKKRPIGHTA